MYIIQSRGLARAPPNIVCTQAVDFKSFEQKMFLVAEIDHFDSKTMF